MSKAYQFTLTSPAAEVISRAKVTAAKNGVDFKGDAEKGGFSGMGIVGHYSVGAGTLHVEITQKPMLMTWGLIEKSLKEFFARS